MSVENEMVMEIQRGGENSADSALSPEERRMAGELWSSLMPAPSPDALILARQALKQAPPAVRDAVTTAIALLWARGRDAASVPNPFE